MRKAVTAITAALMLLLCTVGIVRADSMSNAPGAGGFSPGGLNGNVQYNNAGSFGGYTDTQLTTHINTATDLLSGSVPALTNGKILVGKTASAVQAVSPSGDVASISNTGVFALKNTGTAGTYTNATVTTDAQGRVTAAASGGGSAGGLVNTKRWAYIAPLGNSGFGSYGIGLDVSAIAESGCTESVAYVSGQAVNQAVGTGGGASLILGFNNRWTDLANGKPYLSEYISLANMTDGIAYVELTTDNTIPLPNNNTIAFRFDPSTSADTTWHVLTKDNAGATTVQDTGVAADGTLQHLEIDCSSGTSAVFKINGVVTNTISTNLPTTALGDFTNVYQTGATNFTAQIGRYYYESN